jgi:hypothetical protein
MRGHRKEGRSLFSTHSTTFTDAFYPFSLRAKLRFSMKMLNLLNLAEAGHAAFYRKGLNVELEVACNHAKS